MLEHLGGDIGADERARARERIAISRAYGDLLDPHDWNHVLTLTTRFDGSLYGVQADFKRGVRKLEGYLGQRIDWVTAAEYGPLGGLPHVHALLGNTAGLSLKELLYPWDKRRTQAGIYEPRRGATHYLSKGFGTGAAEFFLSARLPRRL